MKLLYVLCLCLLQNTYLTQSSPSNNRNISSPPSPALSYPGDIYVGILIDLHKKSSIDFNRCGELNPSSVQKLWAAIWAIDTLNNQTEESMPRLGLKIYDTCDNPLTTLHHMLNILQSSTNDFPLSICEQQSNQRPNNLLKLLGVIGVSEAEVIRPAFSLSQLYSVPLILASPSAASVLPAQNNVLTTAPTIASLVQAVVALLEELNVKMISALSSSSAALQDMTSMVYEKKIAIVQSVAITMDNLNQTAMEGSRIIVLMMEPNEIDMLISLLKEESLVNLENLVWVIACPAAHKAQIIQWGHVLINAFLVTPHPVILHDFQDSFINALSRRSVSKPMAIDGYLQMVYNCTTQEGFTNEKPCSQLTISDLQQGFQQDPNVPFVSQGISALAAALRMLQIDNCELSKTPCNEQLKPPLLKKTLNYLMKLSVNIQRNEPKEFEGTRLKFTEDGKLVFKHFDVYFFNGTSPPVQIGWYSDNIGLKVNMVWRQRPWTTRLYATFSELEVTETSEEAASTGSLAGKKSWVSVFRFNHSSFVARGWATTVIIIAAAGVLMTAYIFVYVLIKICDRTLTGNQFLGILLLISVMSMYSTCILFVMPPSEAMCNWRNFLHSFSYSLCYGVLFVKVMQLRSLVSLGLGGRLSHLNQAFTLFYMVGLQVALNIQWSILTRPVFGVVMIENNQSEDGGAEPRCLTTTSDFIWSQVYVMLLLVLTFGYALYTRNIRRNHNEGRWVLLAAGISIPIWISWIVAYLLVPTEYQETAVCGGLILSATIVVCAVFFPKIHTLNARHKAAIKRKELSNSASTATVFSLSQDLIDQSTASGLEKNSKSMVPPTFYSSSLIRNHQAYDAKDKRFKIISDKINKTGKK
ncbi:hypothetical protein CHUAL_002296 [Chamberlinius hualienensis]